MVEIVVRKLVTKAPRRDETSVVERRERGEDGKVRVVRTLDPSSPTFGADFHYIFAKNVAAARRENKRPTVKADVARAKA